MAENKKMWILHYGGKDYETFDRSVLDGIGDKTGTVGFRLKDDRWLEIVVGPGIPIAIEEKSPVQLPTRIR